MEYWIAGSAPGFTSALPNPLPVNPSLSPGNHSADYESPFGVLGGRELNRVLAYWREGQYHAVPVTVADPDGYTLGDGSTAFIYHTADFESPFGVISGRELNRVLAYWRDGHHHAVPVTPENPDGFAPGLSDTLEGLKFRLSNTTMSAPPKVTAEHSAPRVYTAGQTLEVSTSLVYGGTLRSLLWRPKLPVGWTLGSVSGDGTFLLANDEIVLVDSQPHAGPIRMRYTVLVPPGASGAQQLHSQAEYWLVGGLPQPLWQIPNRLYFPTHRHYPPSPQ